MENKSSRDGNGTMNTAQRPRHKRRPPDYDYANSDDIVLKAEIKAYDEKWPCHWKADAPNAHVCLSVVRYSMHGMQTLRFLLVAARLKFTEKRSSTE